MAAHPWLQMPAQRGKPAAAAAGVLVAMAASSLHTSSPRWQGASSTNSTSSTSRSSRLEIFRPSATRGHQVVGAALLLLVWVAAGSRGAALVVGGGCPASSLGLPLDSQPGRQGVGLSRANSSSSSSSGRQGRGSSRLKAAAAGRTCRLPAPGHPLRGLLGAQMA